MLQSEDVWPAMMMGSDELRLELVSGESDQPVVRLRPGEPMDPLSLGRLGYWRILARGVADVHAFVYFDGEGVFVASADPSQPAYINRTPVRGEWTEILPPCELRFGEAVIALRGRPPSQLAANSAYGQGGAWQEAAEMDFDDISTSPNARPRRMPKPDIDVAEDDEEPTRIAPDGSQPAPRRRRRNKPKIRVPSPEEATRMLPLEQPASAWDGAAQAGHAPPWSAQEQPPVDGRPFSPPPGVAPYPQPMLAMPAAPPGVMPMAPPGVMPMAPPGGVPFGAAPLAPGFLPPGVAPQPGIAPGPARRQTEVPTEVIQLRRPRRVPAAIAPYVDKAIAAWRGSSLPQKLILCLLPFAFAAIFVVFTDEEPKPTGTRPKGSASAAVLTSAAPSVSAPAAEATADATPSAVPISALPTAAPTTTGKPGGKAPPKTIERQAADAVVAGSYHEAIKLYEQLAKEHPDQPVYRESIRILRAKLAEPR